MNKKIKVFITGANGFVGKHLISLLLQRNHLVFAGIHSNSSNLPSLVKMFPFDLLDRKQMYKLLKDIQPDAIIHLASISRVKNSWKDPASTFNINTIGTIHLIQAANEIIPEAKIIIAGSSEEYGLTGKKGKPLTEEDSCQPQNPYASSKFAMGQVGLQLAHRNKQTIVHVRPFNHIGPGQPEGFVISDFASQISQMEAGVTPPLIRVGNLDAIRDFTDVRDVVHAYTLLMENEVETGTYNICSGTSRSVRECLDELLKMANIPIHVKIDIDRFRPLDVPIFLGSYKKINNRLDWKPQISFQKSLLDTLEYWRFQVKTNNKS